MEELQSASKRMNSKIKMEAKAPIGLAPKSQWKSCLYHRGVNLQSFVNVCSFVQSFVNVVIM